MEGGMGSRVIFGHYRFVASLFSKCMSVLFRGYEYVYERTGVIAACILRFYWVALWKKSRCFSVFTVIKLLSLFFPRQDKTLLLSVLQLMRYQS